MNASCLITLPPPPTQGFLQVFKLADIYLKALDANFFWGRKEGASYLGGSGGMFPGKFVK